MNAREFRLLHRSKAQERNNWWWGGAWHGGDARCHERSLLVVPT